MKIDESIVQLGGSGPNILLIHGYCSDRQSWVGTAPALFEFGTVWAVDLPGHGKSKRPVGEGKITGLTQVVAEIIRDSSSQPWHIVGHSLGGRIAIELAAEHPELVLSLGLIAPAAVGSGVNLPFMQALHSVSQLDEISSLLVQLVYEPKMISRMVARNALTFLKQPGTRESLARITQGLFASEYAISDRILALKNSSIPTLLIWGNDDRVNPPDYQRIKQLPGKHHFFDKCGHLPHLEKRTQVNKILQEHFESLRLS